jgi:hypothetical protein
VIRLEVGSKRKARHCRAFCDSWFLGRRERVEVDFRGAFLAEELQDFEHEIEIRDGFLFLNAADGVPPDAACFRNFFQAQAQHVAVSLNELAGCLILEREVFHDFR